MGWRVSVYTRDVGAIDTPFRLHGIRVRHLPLRGYADLATALSLAHRLRHSDALTVVHTHKYRDAFLALLARKLARRKDVRVILSYHRVKPGRDTRLARRICRNLHALVFVSRLSRDTFMSAWSASAPPIKPEHTFVLPSSIYMPDYTPAPPPRTGPRIAMYYGRLVPGKGVDTFIEAISELRGRRARARIAGQGDPDYIDLMKRLADRLGVMDLIDWRNGREDPHALMENCHFGVVPSTVPEAFSLPTAMFMAHARPVICTSNGAQREYLTEDSEALFIDPSDSGGLRTAMRRMVDGELDTEAMGRAARCKFENDLDWNSFAANLAKIYRDETL